MEEKQNQPQTAQPAQFYAESLEDARRKALEHIHAYDMEKEEEKKPLIRPKIPFIKWFKGLLLPCVLYVILGLVFSWICIPAEGWVALVCNLAVLVLTIRDFVILMVLIYQKIAPERIRRSCRFEPTCSAYMLLAIEKYGFPRGFVKGIKRLLRCRYPNGGVDYP